MEILDVFNTVHLPRQQARLYSIYTVNVGSELGGLDKKGGPSERGDALCEYSAPLIGWCQTWG